MDLITPQSYTHTSLKPGDMIVSRNGKFIALAIEDGPSGLIRFQPLHGRWYDSAIQSSEKWLSYMNDVMRDCIIYSADEWSLQLVPKQSSQPCKDVAACQCGEKNIVHNGVCLDCALGGV